MEEIDFQGVITSLQADNEQLRERLMKLKMAPRPWELISWQDIEQLVTSPHFLAGLVAGLAIMALAIPSYSLLYIMRGSNENTR